MHEIEAECDLNDGSTTDEIWSGWTWTTNPIGFSERFTIRTDSHQHTNTNIGLHARTDREFLHSTSYAGWPADNAFNTHLHSHFRTDRRRPAPEAVDARKPRAPDVRRN